MFATFRSFSPCSIPHALCHLKRSAPFYLAAILLALALKQHYSLAGPSDLQWILGPTAELVSLLSGKQFTFAAGTGYVCDAGRVIIAPGCAGVNFMLMAFGMAAFTGLHRMRSGNHRLIWLAVSLEVSYALTLGVNALRILLSMHTFQMNNFNIGLTWEWVHRLEGVVIYFFFLYLLHSMTRTIINRYSSAEPVRSMGVRQTVLTGMVPCVWYLAVTIVVPFLNHAPRKTGDQFYYHAVVVLALCVLTWLGILSAQLCGQWFRRFFKRGCRVCEPWNPDR